MDLLLLLLLSLLLLSLLLLSLGLKSTTGSCILYYYSPGKESWNSQEGNSKIGNTLWCFCGEYKPMATHAKNICCLGKYEIRESYFKGILSFVFF